MGIFDISRAHFMPEIDCETCIEIPDEDKLPEDGDVVGRLNRNMYGRRTAAHTWLNDWHELLRSAGYAIGKGNAALFYNSTNGGHGGTRQVTGVGSTAAAAACL